MWHYWWLLILILMIAGNALFAVDGRTISTGSRIREGMHSHGWSIYHRYYVANLIDSEIDIRSLVRDLKGAVFGGLD